MAKVAERPMSKAERAVLKQILAKREANKPKVSEPKPKVSRVVDALAPAPKPKVSAPAETVDAMVKRIRLACGLGQDVLGQLLDVHPMTVSKWERGALVPSEYQQGILRAIGEAQRRQWPQATHWNRPMLYQVNQWMRAHGVVVTLYRLLHEGLSASLALK